MVLKMTENGEKRTMMVVVFSKGKKKIETRKEDSKITVKRKKKIKDK